MEPLISIIVPVYNVENYVGYCISSILDQTYTNIEIIIVNDGSTDSSRDICKKLSEQDNRIKLIDKMNGGLSSARNEGLKHVCGEYVTFIDSDDYVRKDFIALLVSTILADNTDIVVSMYIKVSTNVDYAYLPKENCDHYVLKDDELIYRLLARKIPIYAHGKLYRVGLFSQITFPEGRLYEDIPTNWRIFNNVKKVSIITDKTYFYRQRADSIVNMSFKHRRMDQLYFSEEIYKAVWEKEKLRYAAGSRCFFAAADNYTYVTEKYLEDRNYLIGALKRYRNDVFFEKDASISLKIMAGLSYINPKLVRIVGRIYKKYLMKKIIRQGKKNEVIY